MSEMIKGCLGFKGEKGDPGEIQIADIVDDLNSDSATKPLSAKQGKVLADTKADKTEVITEATTRQSADNNLQTQINGLASGSPLVASSTSGMTDTTRVYVNTTDGHWYYYNGSAWTDGGVYQATEDSETVDDLENTVSQIGLISPNIYQFLFVNQRKVFFYV